MSEKSAPRSSPVSDHQAAIAELARREERARQMGGPEKLAKRRALGILNARERIDLLLDAGSFREMGLLSTSATPGDEENTPGDGKITGFGRCEGRRVAVIANDLTVKGASSATTNSRRIAYMKEAATRNGMPLIFLGESTGSRLPETMGARAMAQGGQDPQQYCRRREIPWISALLGPCFGSSAWYASLSDFIVMRKGALLAVSSPRVTSRAVGEDIDPEELAGWRLHAEVTGICDAFASSDEQALAMIRQFLGYLPSHSNQPAPRREVRPDEVPDAQRVPQIVPVNPSKVYDMRKLIAQVVDRGSFFPLKGRFGKPAITGLARLEGQSVGIVATNPMFKGGALDPEGCRKVTSFLVLCDSFNIPLIFLVDTPGFLVGREGERKGAPAHIMNMMHALQLCSVPKISVIVRKSYGQAFLNLGGGKNSNTVAIWPTADISFMAPEVAANILSDDVDMRVDTSPYAFAGAFGAQAVIRPQDTRAFLVETLDYQHRDRTGGIGRHEMSAWPTFI